MTSQPQYSLSGSSAEMYEQNMVPAIFAPFAKGLLECAQLRPGEQLLDVACGTGIVARLAWAQVAPSGRVVGVDVNGAMLDVARRAAERDQVSVEWKEGDAKSLPLDDESFDVVLCQHGLQYFPERKAALAEMRRVLRSSGRLVLSVWRPLRHNPSHAVFAEVLERRVSAEAAATRRAPFALSDRDEIRSWVTNAQFRDVAVRLEACVVRFPSAEAMIRMMMAGTPLAAAMAKADAATLQTVITEVTAGLESYTDDLGLAMPMQCWLVTAAA